MDLQPICTRERPNMELTNSFVECNSLTTTATADTPKSLFCLCCHKHPIPSLDTDTPSNHDEFQAPIFYGGFDPMANFNIHDNIIRFEIISITIRRSLL